MIPMDELHHGVLRLLGATEPPACLRPRDRLVLGLDRNADEDIQGVELLHSAVIASLAEGNEALGIRCLLALGELCREVECSEVLGALGGHQSILRLMTDGKIPGVVLTRAFADGVFAPTKPKSGREAIADRNIGNVSINLIPSEVQVALDEGEEDEVRDAAALVAAHIVSSGCAFPMRASFPGENSTFGRFPSRYDFFVAVNDAAVVNSSVLCFGNGTAAAGLDSGLVAYEEQGSAVIGDSISILIRPVKERQHSQFDVGFQMWPAATILSRWLCRNPQVIRGRHVLEVGAGLGLCGLVAAHMAATVTLSDFNPLVLRALEANVALNAGWGAVTDDGANSGGVGWGQAVVDGCENGTPAGAVAAIDAPGRVHVRHLDWDMLPVSDALASSCSGGNPAPASSGSLTCDGEWRDFKANLVGGGEGGGDLKRVDHGERFEVILASDHICQTSDAEGTIRVLQTLLAPGGHAHFVVAHPRTRFGVDALVPLLESYPELEFTCEEVSDPDLVEGLEEAAYLAWLHVHVWWAGQEGGLQGEGVAEDFGDFGEEGLLVVG